MRLDDWLFPLLAAAFAVAWVMVVLSVIPAGAHDIYRGVTGPGGQLCCGGDPVTGDCERLEHEQIRWRRDGTVEMRSRRYGRTILIGAETVLPTGIPGDRDAAGHYCGVPRERVGRAGEAPTPAQPDRDYWTFCAFVAPGGV
jgi:hypothetical protein